jgi:hypothetical protein
MAQARLEVTMQGQGLQDGLTKWQKSLGLVRDQTGRLFNAQRQWVDGLNRAQIEMGLYRNALDEVQNQQGQLVTGLQSWEIQLGRYADSLGNVYEQSGNFVRLGAQQIAVNNQLSQSLRGIGMPLLRLASTYQILGEQNTKALSQAVAFASATMSMVQPIQQGIRALNSLRIATQGQAAAQVILNAVSGNWVAIGAGIAAAGGIATTFLATGNAAEIAADKIQNLNNVMVEYNKLSLQNIKESVKDNNLAQAYDDVQEAIDRVIHAQSTLGRIVSENETQASKMFGINWGDSFSSWFDTDNWKEWANGVREQNKADYEKAKQMTEETLQQKKELQNLFNKFGEDVINRNKTEQEKLLEKYTQDLENANKALSIAFGEEEQKYWKKVIETIEKEYGDKSTKDARDKAEKTKQDEERKYNVTIEEAVKYNRSQLSERERRDIELNEQLKKYRDALASTTNKTGEQAKTLQAAIDATEKNIEANNKVASTADALREERQKILDGKKELEERRRVLEILSLGGDTTYNSMYADIQKQMLGDWHQYFEFQKSAVEAFEDGAKQLMKAAKDAGKTQDEINNALEQYEKNYIENMKQKDEKEVMTSASAASRYSAEALKIVAQTNKPEIQAIEKSSDKIVSAINNVTATLRKPAEPIGSTS